MVEEGIHLLLFACVYTHALVARGVRHLDIVLIGNYIHIFLFIYFFILNAHLTRTLVTCAWSSGRSGSLQTSVPSSAASNVENDIPLTTQKTDAHTNKLVNSFLPCVVHFFFLSLFLPFVKDCSGTGSQELPRHLFVLWTHERTSV